ncbi:MAG: hypothetical protein KKH61_20665 [Gammaproteobacteria bacterium]|nr:hypothetical protein [Gammaproteobacteria bacterium]
MFELRPMSPGESWLFVGGVMVVSVVVALVVKLAVDWLVFRGEDDDDESLGA